MASAEWFPFVRIVLTGSTVQADATGALEAVKAAIGSLPQDRVQPRFLLTAASDITKSDIDLAFASGGIIIGFNIDPSEAVLAAAKQYGESEPDSDSVPKSDHLNLDPAWQSGGCIFTCYEGCLCCIVRGTGASVGKVAGWQSPTLSIAPPPSRVRGPVGAGLVLQAEVWLQSQTCEELNNFDLMQEWTCVPMM